MEEMLKMPRALSKFLGESFKIRAFRPLFGGGDEAMIINVSRKNIEMPIFLIDKFISFLTNCSYLERPITAVTKKELPYPDLGVPDLLFPLETVINNFNLSKTTASFFGAINSGQTICQTPYAIFNTDNGFIKKVSGSITYLTTANLEWEKSLDQNWNLVIKSLNVYLNPRVFKETGFMEKQLVKNVIPFASLPVESSLTSKSFMANNANDTNIKIKTEVLGHNSIYDAIPLNYIHMKVEDPTDKFMLKTNRPLRNPKNLLSEDVEGWIKLIEPL